MGANEYAAKVVQYANDHLLNSIDISKYTYQETVTASDIIIDKDGKPPSDFYYEIVRKKAAKQLRLEEELSAQSAEKSALESKINQIAAFNGSAVDYDTELDAWIVTKTKGSG